MFLSALPFRAGYRSLQYGKRYRRCLSLLVSYRYLSVHTECTDQDFYNRVLSSMDQSYTYTSSAYSMVPRFSRINTGQGNITTWLLINDRIASKHKETHNGKGEKQRGIAFHNDLYCLLCCYYLNYTYNIRVEFSMLLSTRLISSDVKYVFPVHKNIIYLLQAKRFSLH